MKAPKNRQSDDEEQPHRQLGVGDPGVAGVRVVRGVVTGRRRAPSSVGVGGLLDRGHQASSSTLGLEAPGEDAEQQQHQARDQPADLVEHRGVAEARAARPRARAGSTTVTACGCRARRRARRRPPACAAASAPRRRCVVAVAADAPTSRRRSRRSSAPTAADQTPVGVLGVLAVPPVVAGLDHRDLGEVVRGRRRRDRPLERAGVPRVVAGDLTALASTRSCSRRR